MSDGVGSGWYCGWGGMVYEWGEVVRCVKVVKRGGRWLRGFGVLKGG